MLSYSTKQDIRRVSEEAKGAARCVGTRMTRGETDNLLGDSGARGVSGSRATMPPGAGVARREDMSSMIRGGGKGKERQAV